MKTWNQSVLYLCSELIEEKQNKLFHPIHTPPTPHPPPEKKKEEKIKESKC